MGRLTAAFIVLALSCASAGINAGPLRGSPKGTTIPPITPSTTMRDYLSLLRGDGPQGQIPLEDHYATTQDGYVLHMHRLARHGAPVVFMQHGILASSWCWMVNDPDRSPAIAIYRMGYDVWLGNSRGNTFSRNHTHLKVGSKAFWDFTFTDMARHDIPASIDKALAVTGKKTLSYVGWSQANTAFLIAGQAAEHGAYLRSKVNLWAALSPVSYLKASTSLLLTTVSKLHLGGVVDEFFPYGFLTGSKTEREVEQFFCKVTFGAICKIGVDTVCGTSSHDDSSMIERMTSHFPAGTSVKDLDHYEQFIDDSPRFFGDFSYGRSGNEKHYNGSKTAPAFPISTFDTGIPTALFTASKDDLVQPADLVQLYSELPSTAIRFSKMYKDFSHLTWLVGDVASWSWFNDLKAQLAKFNPV